MPPAHDSGSSSPDEDSSGKHDGLWHSSSENQGPNSPNNSTVASLPLRHSPTLQKRRRVTRACDECRKKKIKCDGKQPCTHCTVYSYDCTYDQPSNRRRNPAPHYVEALEIRLQRAEALLKSVLPDVDLDDPKLDNGVPQRMHVPEKQGLSPANNAPVSQNDSAKQASQAGELEKDSMLESMVDNTGSLNLDDEGYWDFYGHSSGLVFIRRMRAQFGPDIMGEEIGLSPPKTFFDSPRSSGDSPLDPNSPNTHDLPKRACARVFCENALDDACALMRIVHQPSFYIMFNRIYDIPPEHYGNEENRFLPLLYVVMAVGCLFAKSRDSKLFQQGYKNATEQGFALFTASRSMIDVTDCRDLPSLQAVVFMLMFLQCSAKLPTCYSYIGIALRSSLRMGLHRSLSTNFNFIEQETRKRVFWTIRKMDVYISAQIGMPRMLSDDDIDQELPLPVDDEFITKDRILPMPPGRVSLITATNAHTKLLKILQKVVRYIYPIKGLVHTGESGQSYMVNHAKIREIERDLQEWMDDLPTALRPGNETPPKLIRVQQLLRTAYAHVQMMLYRPFLHYVSQSYQSKKVDKRSYACAAACVSVSRNIIHITGEMKNRGLLIGAYWFTMYTTFFAILSLLFFILENPGSPTSQEILRDANEGKDTLASLAKRSMAADRCSKMLAGVFQRLPEILQRGRANMIPQKKRHAPSPSPVPQANPPDGAPALTGTSKVGADLNQNLERSSDFLSDSNLSAWDRVLLPDQMPPNAQVAAPGLEDDFTSDSHGLFSPSNADSIGLATPETGSIPSFSNRQSLNFPQNFGVNNVPDLSAMMFPSGDPFAYPNQPMTTFENRHSGSQENSFTLDNVDSLLNTNPTSTNTPYDNLEVQLFGALPPYLMQGSQADTGEANFDCPLDMNGIEAGDPPLAVNGNDNGWTQQQCKSGGSLGVNLDDIFGEEWKSGWMDQSFKQ